MALRTILVVLAGGTGLLMSSVPAMSAENPGRLRSALADAMANATAASGAYVYDLSDGRALFSRRATKRRILASNTKLFTTSAALARFGARSRFTTEVLADRAPGSRGIVRGRLYVRGGGDPSFGSDSFAKCAYGGAGGATVADLVQGLRREGVRRVTRGVFGDESLFDSLRGGPDSGYGTSQYVGSLSALSYNGGIGPCGTGYEANPPQLAAAKLTAALKGAGIRVDGKPGARRTPDDAALLASADSITLSRLVKVTNTLSDNFFAETFAKHVDAAPGHPGTTNGGAAAVTRFAGRLGAHVHLVDGSGLARGNLGAPRGVVRFLRSVRHRGFYSALYASFARPREHGTLEERAASRRCRGKTGTISGVSNLSGYCQTGSGDLIAFSFLMNGVGTGYDRARRIQDRMTRAIARYG